MALSVTTRATVLAAPGDEAGDGEPGRHALLVGVEAYAEEHGWPALRGPRADVAAVREALVERLGFDDADVRTLVDEEATRAGIAGAFEELIAAAAPGDVLLFYFSGHGSQLPDDDGDELDGFDETLVPFDARDADGVPNDLRDDDLRALVARANERTPHVALIFDCCSSGTVTRAGGRDGVRFVPLAERGLAGVRPGAGADAAGRSVGGATKGRTASSAGSGYVDVDASYVALSACRAHESALEIELREPGEEARHHGLFTYALLQELSSAGGASYAELMERVRRRVRDERPTQTPVLEGPLDRAGLFGRERALRPASFALEPATEPTRLVAGRLQGLAVEARLAVYREGSVGDAEARVGTIRLDDVGLGRSTFEWVTRDAEHAGALRAVVLEAGVPEARLGYAVEPLDDPACRAATDELLELLGACAALESVPPERAAVHLRPSPGEDGAVRWTATLRGDELALDAPADAATAGALLARLGAAHAAERLVWNEALGEGLDFEVALEREAEDGVWREVEARDGAGVLALGAGERVRWRFRNGSDEPVYASLVVFSPDGEIAVVHRPQNEDDAVPPERTVFTRAMRPAWSERSRPLYEHSEEVFRWVVTARYHDLRGLNRPSAFTAERGVALVPSTDRELRGEPWRTRTVSLRFRTDG